MIAVRVEAPYASFRKSYARSFAETYPIAPPATVYGMLLSLVGEWRRAAHAGVALAFAYEREPKVATVLRKLSRYKYGVAAKQSKMGNAPDYVEVLCGLSFLCWIESRGEHGTRAQEGTPRLEERIVEAIRHPERVTRSGMVCLGMSDDAVDNIALVEEPIGEWRLLVPQDDGTMDLPVWVDHVGALDTRWRRYHLAPKALLTGNPPLDHFVPILDPRAPWPP
jgi:CRISPR-associated protein Cas5t